MGYRVPDLFAQIAASPYFMKVVIPSGAKPAPLKPQQVAANVPHIAKQGAAR